MSCLLIKWTKLHLSGDFSFLRTIAFENTDETASFENKFLKLPWCMDVHIPVVAVMSKNVNQKRFVNDSKKRMCTWKHACSSSYILPFLKSFFSHRSECIYICSWTLILTSVIILSGTLTIFSHQFPRWYKVFFFSCLFHSFSHKSVDEKMVEIFSVLAMLCLYGSTLALQTIGCNLEPFWRQS